MKNKYCTFLPPRAALRFACSGLSMYKSFGLLDLTSSLVNKKYNLLNMKTIQIILATAALIFMASCETYYGMITTIDRNGKVYREIYAQGDSAFMSGNNSSNPFLFKLSPDWNVNRYDTAFNYDFFGDKTKFNVKISKKVNSIEDYSKNIRCDSDNRSLAVPDETLVKKTGWFYTNYSLKVIYKKLQYEAPISIDDYLSKEEQIRWTQGGLDEYKIMNGYEMNDYLNGISDKFTKWQSRNLFEFSLEEIKKLTENYDLDRDKNTIYKKWTDSVKVDDANIDSKTVCKILDSFYKTTCFSKLYNDNREILDKEFNQKTLITNRIGNAISYELVIPGELMQTNAPVIHSDTLAWKVDGVRLLLYDYSLEAKYRVMNKWTFLLTGLLIIISIGSVVVLVKRRR